MHKTSKILITGHSGVVGQALLNTLRQEGYINVQGISTKECDLTDFRATKEFFKDYKPEYVFHLAAAVYGIMGNMKNKGISYLNNTLINTHVIEACHQAQVKKVVAMGTGCVYPYPPVSLPLKEETIWQGPPHSSEDSYAHSKRAMLAQLNAYLESYNMESAFVISGNLYGPHDKFDIAYGHVIPSLVRKFYESIQTGAPVSIWGNGSAKRDFLYADDVAFALINIMASIQGPVNMGSGVINSIRDIVDYLATYTNYNNITWDESMPNGQEYRAYDLNKLFSTGFQPKFSLEEGLKHTYDWYVANAATARK